MHYHIGIVYYLGEKMKDYLKNIKFLIAISLLLFLLETVITSLILYTPGYVFDRYKKETFSIKITIITLVFLFLGYVLVCYGSNRLADYRRIKFEKNIKLDFFNSIMRKNQNKFSEYKLNEYISMQSNDITEICQMYLSPTIGIFRSILMIIIFCVTLIIFVDKTITIVILGLSFLSVLTPNLTEKKLSNLNDIYLREVGRYTDKISEYYKFHKVLDRSDIKKIIEEHRKDLELVFDKNMDFRKINSLAFTLNGASVELINIVIIALVSFLLVKSKITIGQAMTAIMYSGKFIDPLYELNLNKSRIKSVKKIQEKLLNILKDGNFDISNESKDMKDIKFNLLNTSNIEKVFPNKVINIKPMIFERGKKYLLIGENGVGKSLYLKFIMGEIDKDNGNIFLNNKNIEQYNIDNMNNIISYCEQRTIVFNSSYINNVSIFNSKSINNLDFIESLFPEHIIKKLHTLNVDSMSGGEKQIISIIRTLLTEKEIIIMDEPFSAISKEILDYFMKNMYKLDKTIIIVAHNIEKYKDKFDCVYVIGE